MLRGSAAATCYSEGEVMAVCRFLQPSEPSRLSKTRVWPIAFCIVWSPCTALAAGTLEELPVPASAVSSNANAVSVDGNVVVGNYSTTAPVALVRALRWSSQGSLDLGVLPGLRLSTASAVSADG